MAPAVISSRRARRAGGEDPRREEITAGLVFGPAEKLAEKFQVPPDEIAAFIDVVRGVTILVELTERIVAVDRDPDDDMALELATRPGPCVAVDRGGHVVGLDPASDHSPRGDPGPAGRRAAAVHAAAEPGCRRKLACMLRVTATPRYSSATVRMRKRCRDRTRKATQRVLGSKIDRSADYLRTPGQQY